jgi:hypothetical protein
MSKLADAKKVVLESVFMRASEGVPENQIYCILYDFDKVHKIFEYGNDDITPASIIDGLIFRGFITKVCQTHLKECRLYPDEHFMPR